MRYLLSLALPVMTALQLSFCAAAIRPTTYPPDAPPASLWVAAADLSERDAFHGPWGAERAPDPQARYTLVQRKHTGINPGMTVRDGLGREWSVKQAGAETPDEAPVEVALSRILSTVGYHQPPVYYLPSFTLEDDWGTHVEPGGRFRLKLKTLKDRGEWSWQQNPFVGTRPLNGLLVIMMMFNNSDTKNSNNTLYEHRSENGLEHWYVARDLGGALGTTGRLAPLKNDPEAFARHPFVLGIENGYVAFHYRGWHQDLVRDRITAADLAWAACLLDRLSDRQWQDAFRAGGYAPDVAQRFIRTLQDKIAVGRQLGSTPEWTPYKGIDTVRTRLATVVIAICSAAWVSGVQLPGAADSLKFAVIGDNGTGRTPQYEVAQQMLSSRTSFPFTFVLMLGDNLYGSQKPKDFVEKFERPYAPLLDAGVRFYAALGNHDQPTNRSYPHFNMAGERYYTFAKASVRFFVLDTNLMDRAQLTWLEEALARADEPWKVVYFHHPIYSDGDRHGSNVELRVILEPLLVRYDVHVVFSGHEHIYERTTPQKGITYFIQGSSGQLRKGGVTPSALTAASFAEDRTFMLVEIAGEQMAFETISRTGRVVDSGVIHRGRGVSEGKSP